MGRCDIADRCAAPCTRGTWVSCWSPDPELQAKSLRHVDYRDYVPPSLEEVAEAYKSHIRESTWTVGLLEMWGGKSKFVKQAVHVPCWDSFKINPCLWRGVFFGRNWPECLWFGTRQMRWARASYSGALGREYVMPVLDIGRHGYRSDIRALFGMSCALACVFSCGIGQILSLCGNVCANFGAWYTCNSRRKVRQRYGLPPAIPCCLPGIDDFLVDFFCFYCASHQLLRELAIRGVDGPGMHVLDVVPETYQHVQGIEEALEQRRRLVERMVSRRPVFFSTRDPAESNRGAMLAKLDEAFLASAVNALSTIRNAATLGGAPSDPCRELGWNCAPSQNHMLRTNSDVVSGWSELSRAEVLATRDCECPGEAVGEKEQLLEKSWSVAY
jgi:Cys-rich protein (TIGR01571 family)